jgi:hypothetical protein
MARHVSLGGWPSILINREMEVAMKPVILWLLGVPLGVIILLVLFGVL